MYTCTHYSLSTGKYTLFTPKQHSLYTVLSVTFTHIIHCQRVNIHLLFELVNVHPFQFKCFKCKIFTACKYKYTPSLSPAGKHTVFYSLF